MKFVRTQRRHTACADIIILRTTGLSPHLTDVTKPETERARRPAGTCSGCTWHCRRIEADSSQMGHQADSYSNIIFGPGRSNDSGNSAHAPNPVNSDALKRLRTIHTRSRRLSSWSHFAWPTPWYIHSRNSSPDLLKGSCVNLSSPFPTPNSPGRCQGSRFRFREIYRLAT